MSNAANKIILVPVDFTEQSLITMEQARNVAKVVKADIHLLYVYEAEKNNPFARIITSKSTLKEEKQLQDIRIKNIRKRLTQASKEIFEKNSIKAKVEIRNGEVDEEIVSAADTIQPVFIFMGFNNSLGKKSNLLGDNVLKLVRECQYPIITIKGASHRPGCKNIVLPIDESKESREKVGKAIEFAKYFGSTIRIPALYEKGDQKVKSKLAMYARQVEDFIEERGVACSSEMIETDDSIKTVLDYAKRVDADMVMIMTQKEVGLKQRLTGTDDQKLIAMADIPVLSIRPTKKVMKYGSFN